MVWFWTFLLYSFLGFLLETGYACWVGGDPDRKCLLLLPLCPVYGLGMCAVLLLPAPVLRSPVLLAAAGGLTAACVEYAAALTYERLLGVSFWDYRGRWGNLHGRVCLPFTLAWGILVLPAVYLIQPAAEGWFAALPLPVTISAALAAGADLAVSAALLRRTGDVNCLRWYRSWAAKLPPNGTG